MLPSASVEELAPGATVDRYRLVARLGEGGQADVWRAEDTLRRGALVALKLIALPAASSTSADRLRREARLLARLEHPSLPRCHAIFEDPRKDIFGFALDLVDGVALSHLQGTPALTTEHRLDVLLHLVGALRFVHQAGLVHRDIKASNVVIDDAFFARPQDPATVKLLDFGIAAEQDNPRGLTAPGSVIGTVSHLAPELLDKEFWREKVDGPERDLFAFGILAFGLLQGRHPTGLPPGASYGDYLVAYRGYATKSSAWPPGTQGDLLETLYRRCLALRAGERATADEARVLLQQARVSARTGHGLAAAPPVSTTAPTRVASQRSGLPRAATPVPSTSLSWTGAASPPSSAPAVSTAPSRKPSAMAFTTPDVVSHPWSPSAAPRGTRAPAPVHGSSGDWLGSRRAYLLVPLVVLGAFAISFAVSSAGSGSSDDPSLPSAAPVVSAAPAAPTSPPPRALAPDPTFRHAPPAVLVPSSAPPTIVASLCRPGMVAIPGERACIDRTEVTAAEYARSGGTPASEAFWPGADAGSLAAESARCAARRGGSGREPVNCVSWVDAGAYCAKRGQRLPTLDELNRAYATIDHCTYPTVCPVFEWSSDKAPSPSYRKTRGPSFKATMETGSNPELARNEDLGFRCAVGLP